MLDLEEESEYEFPVPLLSDQSRLNTYKHHAHVAGLIKATENGFEHFVFATVMSLCDPYTQPEENDQVILSVDCLADLLIALSYLYYTKNLKEQESDDAFLRDPELHSIKFEMSTTFFTILQSIQTNILNASDELELRFVENDEYNWRQNVGKWTPIPLMLLYNDLLLKTCCVVTCVLIMALYKLFIPESGDYNLALNPYLQYFVKLWKCHTNILVLGLEIDRRLENLNDEDGWVLSTPDVVERAIRDSSTIRAVLAFILNRNPSLIPDNGEAVHDLTQLSTLDFFDPYFRLKVNSGSILVDMRIVIVSLIVVKAGQNYLAESLKPPKVPAPTGEKAMRYEDQRRRFTELSDLLADLDYEDKFDEDVRYMYGCEDVESEEDNEAQEDQESIHSEISLDFDESGRDWRDKARGDNKVFADWFLELKLEDYLTDIVLLFRQFLDNPTKEVGDKIISLVAKAIADSARPTVEYSLMLAYDFLIMQATPELLEKARARNKTLIPIYVITNFEILLHFDSEFARCIMDELLMWRGHRRIIIWFLTHNVNISSLLIDYVYELLIGRRGNLKLLDQYRFSRKGDTVILTDVERLMLLHEFLINCGIYLGSSDAIDIGSGLGVVLADSVARKLMTMLCLMINQLINHKIIDLDKPRTGGDDIDDYNQDLQVLLINWIGKLPAARELFFKVRNTPTEHREEKEEKDLKGKDQKVEGKESKDRREQEDAQPELDEDPADDSALATLDAFFNQPKIKTGLASLVNYYSTKNEEFNAAVLTYTNRMYRNVRTLIALETGELHELDEGEMMEDLALMEADFRFFLTHFNTFSKIDYFIVTMFTSLLWVLQTGLLSGVDFDPEFSDLFLNGKNVKSEKEGKKKKKKKKSKKK